jgi:uncharacterized membrane protein YgcG
MCGAAPQQQHQPPPPPQAEDPYAVTERAMQAMEQKRAGQVEKLSSRLGDRVLAYDAILAERRRRLAVQGLMGEPGPVEVPDVGSMVSNGDQRLLATNLEINLAQQKVVTASFNPATMLCKCDAPHAKKKLATFRHEEKGGMEVIFLTDQSFPATPPVHGSKKCIKVLRVEHGLLSDLTVELTSLLKGRYLEAGGAVMLFLATNLAGAGMAGYCADLMHAIATLKKDIGEHLIYTPLPHLFGQGCMDEQTVRSAVEVSAWAAQVFGKERSYLKRSFEVANRILAAAGIGGAQTAVTARYHLPTMEMMYRTWASSGLSCMPKACRLAGEAEEKQLITTIIKEIRRGLAIDLDPAPSFEIGVPAMSGGVSKMHILLIGDTGVDSLNAALKAKGCDTDLIVAANLRITKANVDLLLPRVKEAIERKTPDGVILQFMDNSVFAGLSEEGEMKPPRRQGDRLHIEGDLAVYDRPVINKLLAVCKPILVATAGIKTVLVGPLPRYATAACCNKAAHMPNRMGARFLEDLMEDLEGVHKIASDYLFKESLRHIRVMNPWVGLRGLSPTNIWGDDPTSIRLDMMGHLVEGIFITLNKITLKRRRDSVDPVEQKRGRGGGSGGGQGSRGIGGGGHGSSSGRGAVAAWGSARAGRN